MAICTYYEDWDVKRMDERLDKELLALLNEVRAKSKKKKQKIYIEKRDFEDKRLFGKPRRWSTYTVIIHLWHIEYQVLSLGSRQETLNFGTHNSREIVEAYLYGRLGA